MRFLPKLEREVVEEADQRNAEVLSMLLCGFMLYRVKYLTTLAFTPGVFDLCCQRPCRECLGCRTLFPSCTRR
jgi:hypothetical protein